ncbi:MAG: UbiA family prenyltransferase [Cyclobacteriaceae bacterium]
MLRSTLLHLRFPFSFFLLPVFLFALAVSEEIIWQRAIAVGLILHLMLYPASNGFNSYFDKDEGSIGGLKEPPKVAIQLYYASLLLDFLGLALALIFIGWEFTMMLFAYGLASKAYSHPAIRLKKYPVIGWLTIFFFQGHFTFLMVLVGLGSDQLFSAQFQIPAVLSSLLLGGSYPMTQIYQHKEDAGRGDLTLSRMLGIKGTFHFTAIFFLIANSGFAYYFIHYLNLYIFLIFQAFLAPSFIFFLWWYWRVTNDSNQANYEYTMNLNLVSSSLLNLFFLGLIVLK